MKISYSLRAFGLYFIILGLLIWFTLDNAIERLNDGMRQSAESVLVDTAHILAAYIEDQVESSNNKQQPSINQLERIYKNIDQRKFTAKIYQITKTNVDAEVYVVNTKGKVIFDSSGNHTGDDFSRWNDVKKTLEGEYGARSSYIFRDRTQPNDPKAMVIAAPIYYQDKITGAVSVMKPINSLEAHLRTESSQLQRYAFALLFLALVIGYLLSIWFTRSLNKIANYVTAMAEGKSVEAPKLRDSRLADLTNSVSYLRTQLDGKEYVEDYIHSLTHELKTPITSIRGAVELMQEDMPAEDRTRFLINIKHSNQRMSRLVDRMLSLAKLEGLTKLVATEEFDIIPTIERLLLEQSPLLKERNITVTAPEQKSFTCVGDRVLLSQAISNLLDNAIGFCHSDGNIMIHLSDNPSGSFDYQLSLFNQGDPIPEFALGKLFDRFFSLPRPHQSDTTNKSTGLGLSFVREIMKLHNGKITINNVTGGVEAVLKWKK